MLFRSLDDGTSNHDETADGDGKLTAKVIGEQGDNRDGHQATNLVEGTDKTQKGTRGLVEVILPCFEVLDRVEEHAIITSGGRGNAKNDGVEVQLAKTGVFAPFDSLELGSLLDGDRPRLGIRRLIKNAHGEGFFLSLTRKGGRGYLEFDC